MKDDASPRRRVCRVTGARVRQLFYDQRQEVHTYSGLQRSKDDVDSAHTANSKWFAHMRSTAHATQSTSVRTAETEFNGTSQHASTETTAQHEMLKIVGCQPGTVTHC